MDVEFSSNNKSCQNLSIINYWINMVCSQAECERTWPRTPQDMDGRLKGVFSELETSRNMEK